MALVQSLLTAIVRADGDALVMHVGERPYVIAPSGTIELSAHGLNLDAMSGMLGQLLTHDALRALDDFGAIEHELSIPGPTPGDRFTVVAARGGDDVWIELRRHRGARASVQATEPAHVMAAAAAGAAPSHAAAASAGLPDPSVSGAVSAPHPVHEVPHAAGTGRGTSAEQAAIEQNLSEVEPVTPHVPAAAGPSVSGESVPTPAHFGEAPLASSSSSAVEPPSHSDVGPEQDDEPMPSLSQDDLRSRGPLSVPPPPPELVLRPWEPEAITAQSTQTAEPPAGDSQPGRWSLPSLGDEPAPVVVPLTRSMRIETAPRGLSSRPGGIDRLLRVASSRGASALYLPSQARPHIRIDGDIRLLEGEPVLTSTDVESAVLELMPENARDALRRGEPTEWVCDLADIGRIRCTTFRDYRGPGALFQMISARAASAEQLGLSREIQALSTETEGLIIVAGPRGSGKSTLVAAFVDLINRRRADYVITLERQIRLVHDNRSSLISQREIRGSAEEIVAQARAALRENPDVLVIEDLRSPDVLQVALDAAGSGLLVLLSMTAASATAAIDRVLDLVPAERRRPVRAALAETLRGVVTQVLLRKSGGGRLAARELLLNTAAVASSIADGQTSQLPLAIDSGRRHGMVPLNDALVAFVQSGAVDVREAYRKAADRSGLLTLLKREGIDTSFAERLA